MPKFDLTRANLEQYSVDLRQFIDFRMSTLPNGMRIVEAFNSSGLNFTLLPDRGLDIWTMSCNGLPLTWISQGSPHLPDYGASWLQLFNGGVLVTCGLHHVGPPETDAQTGAPRDLHGDYTRRRAGQLSVQGRWEDDRYVLDLTGAVAEASFFGAQLRLTRTVRMVLGEPKVEIFDTVENLFDAPAPFMLLHHFNFGYPLVQKGVRLYVGGAKVTPRDEVARAAAATWQTYQEPVPLHQEEVFFHQVVAGEDKLALAALAGNDFGVQLEWDTTHEPYLTQWKNFRRSIYLCGVEPGNCLPEGQNQASASGRLVMLEPGEQHKFYNRLTILPNAEAVGAMMGRVAALRANGQAVQVELADLVG